MLQTRPVFVFGVDSTGMDLGVVSLLEAKHSFSLDFCANRRKGNSLPVALRSRSVQIFSSINLLHFVSSNSDSSTDDDLTSSTPSSRLVVPSSLAYVAQLLETQEEEEPALFPAIKRNNRVLLNEPTKRDMVM